MFKVGEFDDEVRYVEAEPECKTEKFLEEVANLDIIELAENGRSAIVRGKSILIEMLKGWHIRIGCPQK